MKHNLQFPYISNESMDTGIMHHKTCTKSIAINHPFVSVECRLQGDMNIFQLKITKKVTFTFSF